ncbi:hypothetical protein ANCDUO_00658 [Ancylostoma duodenale]|uniref:Uncharacterized protein n=1 Tax=Ancylostoma duodenale TaxID=51022 RepID=A0A0C2HH99_9BILA|nr:hypothetical protein ANCDUO_00658 [Ancylostoma duodenale]
MIPPCNQNDQRRKLPCSQFIVISLARDHQPGNGLDKLEGILWRRVTANKETCRSAELRSSFLNRLTLWWFNTIPRKGARKDLEVRVGESQRKWRRKFEKRDEEKQVIIMEREGRCGTVVLEAFAEAFTILEDLFELNEGGTTEYLSNLWKQHWEPRMKEYLHRKEQRSKSSGKDGEQKGPTPPSVVACLLRMFRWEFLSATALKITSDILQFANPFFLHDLKS